MKTTHEMMFNDFENPWKAFRSLLLNAAVLNILIRPRRPCQRLCGETFHWHRWLDAKFSLNSPNFNYFGRLFVRRATKISPKANYGRRHFCRNAIKTNAGSRIMNDFFVNECFIMCVSCAALWFYNLQNQYRFHAGSWFEYNLVGLRVEAYGG